MSPRDDPPPPAGPSAQGDPITDPIPGGEGAVPARVPFAHRFQTRLLAYLVAFSAVTSAVAGYVYYNRQVQFVRVEQWHRGRTLITNLAGQSGLGAYSGDAAFLRGPVERVLGEPDVAYVAIYDHQGELLFQQARPGVRFQPAVHPDIVRQALASRSGTPLRRRAGDHDDLLLPILGDDRDAESALFGAPVGDRAAPIGLARIGLSRRLAQARLAEVLRWGGYVALITLGLGVLVALFIAARLSSPVLALARGAEAIRAGDLGHRVPLQRRDELGLLAESFNRMSEDLGRTVATLAHLNRNLEAEVARRTVALRRGRDFARLLNAPLQLRTLLESALGSLVRQTGARAGAVYLAGAEGELELAVAQGPIDRGPAPAGDSGATLLARAAGASGPLLVSPPPPGIWVARACPRTWALLYLPLRFRDELQAVVLLLLGRPLPEETRDFLTSATAQLAVSVANARAYAAAERLAADLEVRNIALREQRDQLQELNRLKSEFLANISHELRTPLNAILGYAELLQEGVYGELDEAQRESVQGIADGGQSLLGLINQLLDLTRVEAGKMPVILDDVDLAALVRDVVEASRPLARDRPYDIALRLPDQPLTLRTDAAKVRQVVVNLLSNAVKFTSEGEVAVTLAPRPGGGGRIIVTDTGVGIREDDLDAIFDEFRQVDGAPTRAFGGTGLGLAISRRFARLVGGDVLVTSVHGRGSTFELVLPAEPPQAGGTERRGG